MNVVGTKSQVGIMAMIQKKQESKEREQSFLKAVPIMWSSSKSQRVATNIYGSEMQAVFQAFDAGTVSRSLISEVIFGHSQEKIQVDVRNNNLSLANSINAVGSITQEKRLIVMLEALREMLQMEEIQSIKSASSITNMAGGLSKATAGNDLQLLMTENKCLKIKNKIKMRGDYF